MTTQTLRHLATTHRDLADAYQKGADTAERVRHETMIECQKALESRIPFPSSCRNPGVKLTRKNQRIKEELIRSIEIIAELYCNFSTFEDDDEIPF